MIIKGKDVIGLNVVTVDTGSVIQTVDDIAYDPNTHRIVALLVDSGGLFSSAKAIHMDDVHNIGEDAVIVHDANAIKSIKELSDSVRSISDSNKHLVKTNVLTVDGKELGKVTDIYFDSASGIVDSMEVSQGGLKTMTEGKKSIRPADIVTIGADATIVSTYTEGKLEAQGEEGGLKGALNDTKDKATELKDKTVEKAAGLSATARVKADELKERSRESSQDAKLKAEELADSVQERAQQVKAIADEKSVEAKQKVSELNDKAQERISDGKKNIKDSARNASATIHNSSDKVVAKTKKYQDSYKTVETRKTVIKK